VRLQQSTFVYCENAFFALGHLLAGREAPVLLADVTGVPRPSPVCLLQVITSQLLQTASASPAELSFLDPSSSAQGTGAVLPTELGLAVLGAPDAHRLFIPFPQENTLIQIKRLKFASLRYIIIEVCNSNCV